MTPYFPNPFAVFVGPGGAPIHILATSVVVVEESGLNSSAIHVAGIDHPFIVRSDTITVMAAILRVLKGGEV